MGIKHPDKVRLDSKYRLTTFVQSKSTQLHSLALTLCLRICLMYSEARSLQCTSIGCNLGRCSMDTPVLSANIPQSP